MVVLTSLIISMTTPKIWYWKAEVEPHVSFNPFKICKKYTLYRLLSNDRAPDWQSWSFIWEFYDKKHMDSYIRFVKKCREDKCKNTIFIEDEPIK